MRLIVAIFISLLLPVSIGATEFKLLDFDRYGPAPSMELSLCPTGGYQLSEIFQVLEFTNAEFTIRLIGRSSAKTNSEIMKYYRDSLPEELALAINTARNVLHKPALQPLKDSYSEALKSTTLYAELLKELVARGYRVDRITHEKFCINDDGSISIPDTYINVTAK